MGVTKLCVKDCVRERLCVCDKGVCERLFVIDCVCDKVVCERLFVTDCVRERLCV